MKRLALSNLAFALTAGLIALSNATSAQADAGAAFCLWSPGANSVAGCDYYTLAQCQAASRGPGGSCTANPMAAAARQRDRATR